MKLSPNFSLAEFTRSETAKKLGIRNEPGMLEINALSNLCVNVLEPIREHFGKPVIVTSGYRSPALNKAIGGSDTSQHTKGQAADIKISGVAMADIWNFISTTLAYDQVIAEKISRRNGSAGWIHVSYNLGHNRYDAKSFIGKGQYPRGLHYID